MQYKSAIERYISSVGRTDDITQRYQIQKDMIMDALFECKDHEQWENKIIQEIIARVSVELDDRALKQLHEMLKNLGR